MGNRPGCGEALARIVRAGQGFYIGPEVVFALQRSLGETPQHGDLSDMRQGIGDWALEQAGLEEPAAARRWQ